METPHEEGNRYLRSGDADLWGFIFSGGFSS